MEISPLNILSVISGIFLIWISWNKVKTIPIPIIAQHIKRYKLVWIILTILLIPNLIISKFKAPEEDAKSVIRTLESSAEQVEQAAQLAPVAPVPEPATALLFICGLVVLLLMKKK